ncbi:MAG: TatD family hydrolase [Pseudomonadota bacterium]
MAYISAMLVDTHAHLDMPGLMEDVAGVLERARAAGVERVITIGTDLESSRAAADIAARHRTVHCSVGLHPHEARFWNAELAAGLRRLAATQPKVVGWGETGLDFHYPHSPPEAQERAFREQIRLAAECGLPLMLHVREAHQEALRILAEEGAGRGVLHCFSGGVAVAERVLDMGFYISLAGPLTFGKKATELAEVARVVPLERLLVETDSPYLAPVPYRGKPNEPAYVVHTAARLAELKGLDPAEVARATTGNARALFFGLEPSQPC